MSFDTKILHIERTHNTLVREAMTSRPCAGNPMTFARRGRIVVCCSFLPFLNHKAFAQKQQQLKLSESVKLFVEFSKQWNIIKNFKSAKRSYIFLKMVKLSPEKYHFDPVFSIFEKNFHFFLFIQYCIEEIFHQY